MSELFIPPHSIESEQSVLGGLLLDPRAWDRIADIVEESDFYRDDHRRIFRHIRQQVELGRVVDVLTISDSIAQSNEVDQAGGLAYLAQIANNVPSAANIRRYAEIVVDKRQLRDLQTAASDILAIAQRAGQEGAAERIDQAQGVIFGLADKKVSRHEPTEIGAVLGRVIDQIQARYESAETISGLKTGFIDLDEKTSGLQKGDLIIIAGRPSMGKAQPLSAQVLMQDGRWNVMSDIRFGDHIASTDGRESRVIGIYPQGQKEIYRVTLSDGRSTRCCAEHLWSVDSSRWVGGARVKTTAELMKLVGTEKYRHRITVPLINGKFGLDDALVMDPWLLGALLANGSCDEHQVRFSTPDAATLYRIQECVGADNVRYGGKYDYRINQGASKAESAMAAMRELGLVGKQSHDKFIPEQYMRATYLSRLNLLRGILDTDGWVEKFGAVRIALSNAALANQVQALVRSLGGTCKISSKLPTYTYDGDTKTGLRSYVCNIQHPDRGSLMTLARKQRRCIDGARFRNPTVVDIVADGMEDAMCIRVSHPSSLYVTDEFVVTHNTAFALNIAENVAIDQNIPALVFSLEMSDTQLATRALSSVAKIDSQRLQSGRLMEDDWDAMTNALARLHTAPLIIDQSTSLSVPQMRARARRIHRKYGKLGLIVIDYLQLMTSGHGNNRNEDLSELTRGLKLMAKDLDCPVICLSQLSRKVEERTDKRPMMSDLRESGAIEQDADLILMMYRDDYYNPNSSFAGLAEANIVKQRMGPTGSVRLVFRGEYSRFDNADAGMVAQAVQRAHEAVPIRRRGL